MSESLAQWIEREFDYAATAMLRSVSPLALVKSRPGFGQSIRAIKGAIVASPVLASWDPDPDYFFHWYRDSAVVIDALRLLFEDGRVGQVESTRHSREACPGMLEAGGGNPVFPGCGDSDASSTRNACLMHLHDFTRFSLGLAALDGRVLIAAPQWRTRVAEDFVKFLRSDAELASVHGDAVCADTRVNADGTLDISNWNRPQHDGAPLRALALLRWVRENRHVENKAVIPAQAGIQFSFAASTAAGIQSLDSRLRGNDGCFIDCAALSEVNVLIRADLAFTFRHWHEPSFDIWEEEKGLHYYTLRVSAAALEEGADWLDATGERDTAQRYREAGATILQQLDGYWLEDEGHYRSRAPLSSGVRSAKELDIAVILAAIHAQGQGERHSVDDPRMHATLKRLEALFDAAYAINRTRAAGRGPAMGRYAGDVYFSGGAYYFSTLGAAEFCFQAARDTENARAWIERGDAYLETVRAFTPASGELSEQFDQTSGAQRSARHLAWSYAAFISCVAARRRVVRASS